MKKTISFLSLFLLFIAKEFKAQTWEWATKLEGTLGATDQVVIKGIDTDMFGNSYVTGYYTGQLNSAAANTSNLQDGFIAKFDAFGILQWAHKFGGPGADAGNAISVETHTSNPGIFITGYVQYNDPTNVTFNGTSTPKSMPSVTACISASPPNNIYLRGGLSSKQIFVARYDANGNIDWMKPVYSSSCQDGEGLGIVASYHHQNGQNYERRVYVTGYFEGNSASFMTSAPCTFTTLNGNTGNKTAFVAKLLVTNGNTSWARSLAVPANGNAMSIGKNITLDAASALGYIPGGGLFITGDYVAAADVCGTSITNTTGITRAYVAHINPSTGAALWVSQIESTGPNANVQARDIRCASGNRDSLYVLGDFSGSVLTSGTFTASNGGGRDIYIIRMRKSIGTSTAGKAEGGLDDQYGYGMDIGADGGVGGNAEIFVSGAYNNSISFAGGPSFSFYGSTTNDHYLSKYDLGLVNICATHWDASMVIYPHTLDACDVAADKQSLVIAAHLGGMFLSSESPVFSPMPALTTSKPISSYVSKWICCDCPPPSITMVDRPFPGTLTTVYFNYPPCDNQSGTFILESLNPPMNVPVSWGSTFTTVPTAALPTQYTWQTYNSCQIRSAITMARATSLNESGGTGVAFDVYPNPSGQTIYFKTNQKGSIEIYNILGVLLRTKQISSSSETNLDVTDLPNGNYLCKFITQDNNILTKKIQVAH